MLAAADHLFDPTFPGLFAGDPPAEFVPLLEEMAAAVRPGSMRTALLVMAEADQRDLLPRIAVPTLLIWGELEPYRGTSSGAARTPRRSRQGRPAAAPGRGPLATAPSAIASVSASPQAPLSRLLQDRHVVAKANSCFRRRGSLRR